MRYVLAQVTSQPVPEPDPWDPDITLLLRMLCFLGGCVFHFCHSILKLKMCLNRKSANLHSVHCALFYFRAETYCANQSN